MHKLFFVLLLFATTATAQTTVKLDSAFAPSLSRTKSFVVILPAGYSEAYRYPVLYLLHGFGGDHTNWTTLTKISTYAEKHSIIIVMPDGENSWYVNSATDAKQRFEDYLITDLPATIQRRYNVDTAKQAIAGLSMGGYGAVVLALRYPKRFLFAGSLSGAVGLFRDNFTLDGGRSNFGVQSLQQTFGAPTETVKSKYDPFKLSKAMSPKPSGSSGSPAMPYIYLAIGIQDGLKPFLPRNRELADTLRAIGAAYEYHEVQGGHDWKFWDREIQPLLKRLNDFLP
ncbi:MAG: esterase family protein [Rhizobacter sp.]|nr:esterase family protein [Chlorobiales bacterium]